MGDKRYVVVWDNGNHAAGELPGQWRTKKQAIAAAREWKRDMVNADDDKKAAKESYTWDVISVY